MNIWKELFFALISELENIDNKETQEVRNDYLEIIQGDGYDV